MEIDRGPQPRRPPDAAQPWATARLAALLATVLALLVSLVAVLPTLQSQLGGTGGPGGPGPSSSAAIGSPAGSVTPSFVRPTPTPQPTPFAYVVRTGDTLIGIARQFGTTARSIGFWNRDRYPSLDPESEAYRPDRIGVGWTLFVIPKTVYDEDAEPSGSPGASPTPPASSASPATPAPTGPATVVSNGSREGHAIALTFDLGGRLDPAVDIMDWLVEHRVKATIFPTGKLGSTTPIGREVMRIVRDHPDLFTLGNHSWDHPSFTELPASQMHDQLWRTEEALSPLAGRTTRPWFRPPYGAWTKAVRDGVGAAGWRSIVMWDIDTIDWRSTSEGGPTATDIEAKVLANARGGSIVLMHLGGWHTLEALPRIVDGLGEHGLEPVTLAELLGG